MSFNPNTHRLSMLILYSLFLFTSTSILIPRTILQPIDPPEDLPFRKIPTPIKPIKVPLPIPQQNTAQTYKGITQIHVPDGESNSAQYFISFSKYSVGCDYVGCYYGWVDNFTIAGSQTVLGYPGGSDQIKPVFEFKTNSKTDYVIHRHPQLSDSYIDIIEVGCELFEPTIKTVSQVRDNARTTFGSARALFAAMSGEPAEYTFIPQADFSRMQPKNTQEVDPSTITAPINPDTNAGGISAATKTFARKISINADAGDINQLKVASISRRIAVGDLKTRVNQMQERVTIDREYLVVRRSRFVNLDIPSDSFNAEAEQDKPNFVSNINVHLEKKGNQQIDHQNIKPVVNNIKATGSSFAFTAAAIKAKRQNVDKVKFYNENFNVQDQPNSNPSQDQANEVKVQNADIQWNICNPFIVSTPPVEQPVPQPPVTPVQVPPKVPRKIPILDPTDPIQRPIRPIGKQLSLLQRNIYPARRLLLQTPVFTYEKSLFEKEIFGKKFKVTIKIEAAIVDNKNVRFKGVLLYDLFGNSRSINIFSYTKDVTLSWSKAYDLNGSWSFSIYIPLPPPVSFLGINFSFGVNYKIHVDIYAKGSPEITACIYNFEIGANAETGVGVDASAAVRAIVIEGGVFISGDLVKLSTDPKLSIGLNIQTKSIVTHVTWYFYIKAFYMEWGFFYRYWKLFKGWSGRKIISKWPISNGITKKYLVYQS